MSHSFKKTFSLSTSQTLEKYSLLVKSMAWTCSRCTFINPPSQKPTCQICLSPSPSSLPSSSLSSAPSPFSAATTTPKWSCKACTFLNPYRNTNCEVCGARASALSSISIIEDDDELDSAVGSVFLPLRACKRKNRDPIGAVDDCVETDDFRGVKSASKEVISLDVPSSAIDSKTLKILSYNVWFREDLEMHKRMKALGDLIQLHSPHLICFQEVTPNIYDIFQQSSWWKGYRCSVSNEMAFTRPYFCMQLSNLPVKSFNCKPFSNSIMGRELCVAEVEVETNKPLVIATSHLESPCPAPPKWDQMFSKERVYQAKEAVNFLKENPNIIFCGDMNWDDKLDGSFPLLDGWVDAWAQLRPGENGWTYDTKSNQMLSGNRTLQKRLDRFVCNLRDFKVSTIEMIGVDAIPGLSYCKEKKVKTEVKKLVLPVLPSDHYGLLLTISNQ
ncbi:Tyrosyl-DNA phosphodiesterase [Actinidia chinensis var. chinensis]|uniref:Tyrosyl-DNA phosphodiesterase n=1 Tax=Actinidia chinensis var. chinensis TaxID=1590841 RepID=A0A2R6PXC8_ACTCC|nr:Tyrosyl-DNA phosphodiesterase [Actinidia chinensis var. chinensis]